MVRLTEPLFERIVPVGGDRVMGVSEFGAPAGRPIVWFHGTPGGGRQIPEGLRQSCADEDVRLVVIERPGYGRSSHHRYGRVSDINTDVEIVLDELGIDRFCVAGLSGGGPYTLAVAHGQSDRVVSAVVLGGVGPHAGPDGIPGGAVGVFAPLAPIAGPASRVVGRAFQGFVAVMTPVSGTVFGLVSRLFPEGDQVVFAEPEIEAMFLDDIIRQTAGGLPGPPLDLIVFVREWGFNLADLSVPVHFWHGDADPIVPLGHAEHMAGLVPGATLVVRPAESHLGGFAVAEEAVKTAMSHWED